MRAALLVLALALALSGCGGSDPPEAAPGPAPGPDAEPEHIHALAIDPADGALLIATHGGLYRADEDSLDAARVGDSRSDLMGLAVLGPGHYLASGHPLETRPEGGDPISLGVIESHDAGESWEAVALDGEADLHAIRVAGDRIYGADGLRPRTLVSTDGGREWEERGPSIGLLDLTVHPHDRDRLVAVGRHVLLFSDDAGRTWTTIGDPIGERWGYAAWPEPDRLLVVDAAGALWRSADEGASWESVGGSVDGLATTLLAVSARELYVALDDGTVKHSLDGGRTWRLRSRL